MSEPVPCPLCQTPIILQPGVSTVQCPNCRAELELDPDEAPPTAPPPPAPVQAKRIAPLPFGRPTAAPPPPDLPPPVNPARRPVRARAVPEAPPPAAKSTSPYAVTKTDPEAEAAARRRHIERELAELDRAEERAEARYERVTTECDNARIGLLLFAVACWMETAATLLLALFLVLNMSGVVVPLMGSVATVCHWLAVLVIIAGFAACARGPHLIQGSAWRGLGLTGLHLMLTLGGMLFAIRDINMRHLGYDSNPDEFLLANLPASNVALNLTTVADLPVYVQMFGGPKPGVIAVNILAGVIWFAAVSTLGILVHQLATGGKEGQLAHSGVRFVYRVFVALVLAALVKGVVIAVVTPDDGWIPVLFGTVGFCLWYAFAWSAAAQTIADTRTVVTSDRWLDTRDRLDVV